MQAALHEFGVSKLDISSIAQIHRKGKAWRTEASARSTGSSGSAASTARSHHNNGSSRDRTRGDCTAPSSSRSVAYEAAAAAGAATCKPVASVPVPGIGSGLGAANVAGQAATQQTACSMGSAGQAASGDAAGKDTPHACSNDLQSLSSKATLQAAAAAAASSGGRHASTGHETALSAGSISADSTRLPAAMKVLPCPRLLDPTEEELASLPMPSLPVLLDLSHDPVKVLHARLERVWAVLGTPPEQQMDMVLR